MNKFLSFLESSEAKNIKILSPIIILQMLMVTPLITYSNIEWLILLVAPMEFIINISCIAYTIKQYKSYTRSKYDS